jgi:hypothetical protein
LREKHRLRVFENRVLRKIFGPKRDNVTEAWRRLHEQQLYGLCSSSNIIWGIKYRRMRWAGRVTHGRQERCIKGFCLGDLRESDHFEDIGIDGSVILQWNFKKWNVASWTGLLWLRIGKWGGGRL